MFIWDSFAAHTLPLHCFAPADNGKMWAANECPENEHYCYIKICDHAQ